MTNSTPPITTPVTSNPRAGGAPTASTSTGSSHKGAKKAAKAAKTAVDTAKTEAASVASEATSQAKKLASQAGHELKDQASTQQRRLADGLRSVSTELSSMSTASQTGGVASDIVSSVGRRVDDAASWLENREPRDVLDEVTSFARSRPGVFIGIAAVAGILAGRLTRSLATADSNDEVRA